MEDYQQRVIDEKNELDNKIRKLSAFIFSDKFENVSPGEQDRMEKQLFLMMEYSKILKQRVSLFVAIERSNGEG